MSQAGELRVRRVILLGGEPTLRSDLVQLVIFSKTLAHAETEISTNGSFLTQQFIGELRRAGLDKIQLSIHLEQAMRDVKTCGDTLTRFLEEQVGIVRFLKEVGLRVGVNLVLMKRNLSQVLRVLNYMLSASDVDVLILSPLFLSGRALDPRMLPSRKEVKSIFPALASLRRRYGHRLGIFGEDVYAESGAQTCFTSPKPSDFLRPTHIVVVPNGEVLPSNHLAQPGVIDNLSLGNVRNQPLAQIVESYYRRVASHSRSGANRIP